VIAAVVRLEERYLLGRRPDEKRHGGLWEFPGGKLDPGESMADAARRELHEELGVTVRRLGATRYSVRDEGSPFLIEFVDVEVEGVPVALEHSELGWFTPAEMGTLPLAPADARFAAWLERA